MYQNHNLPVSSTKCCYQKHPLPARVTYCFYRYVAHPLSVQFAKCITAYFQVFHRITIHIEVDDVVNVCFPWLTIQVDDVVKVCFP